MTTFDGWNTLPRKRPLAGSNGQLSNDELMHFRTKGSKNGVRRFQTEDGTWTPLGLRERKEREGWGESRKERKLAKKIARSEKHEAKKAAKSEAKAERAEKRRKSKLSGLTDEEMKAKLERARMEAEYRDLKKRGSMIETGAKLIDKYLDYQDRKAQRTTEMNRQKLEMERLKTQQIQAKKNAKSAKYRIKSSKNEAKKAKSDSESAKWKNKEARAKSSKYKEKKNWIVAKRSYKMAKKNHWKNSQNNTPNNKT